MVEVLRAELSRQARRRWASIFPRRRTRASGSRGSCGRASPCEILPVGISNSLTIIISATFPSGAGGTSGAGSCKHQCAQRALVPRAFALRGGFAGLARLVQVIEVRLLKRRFAVVPPRCANGSRFLLLLFFFFLLLLRCSSGAACAVGVTAAASGGGGPGLGGRSCGVAVRCLLSAVLNPLLAA